jgi:hypothetical protein
VGCGLSFLAFHRTVYAPADPAFVALQGEEIEMEGSMIIDVVGFNGVVSWMCAAAGVEVRLQGESPTGNFHNGDRRFPVLKHRDERLPVASAEVPVDVRSAVLKDLVRKCQPPAPDPIDELTGSDYVRAKAAREYNRWQGRA